MGITTNDDKTNNNIIINNNKESGDAAVGGGDDVVVDVDDSNIPDARPLKYGTATPPPISASQDIFQGRSGVWICEHCSCKVVLEPHTKQWTCRRCHRVMYTMPKDDNCPLDTFCPCCCWDMILTRN